MSKTKQESKPLLPRSRSQLGNRKGDMPTAPALTPIDMRLSKLAISDSRLYPQYLRPDNPSCDIRFSL